MTEGTFALESERSVDKLQSEECEERCHQRKHGSEYGKMIVFGERIIDAVRFA